MRAFSKRCSGIGSRDSGRIAFKFGGDVLGNGITPAVFHETGKSGSWIQQQLKMAVRGSTISVSRREQTLDGTFSNQ